MTLSTHVLDIALGLPATGVNVTLLRCVGDATIPLAQSQTDENGRIAAPFGGELEAGEYELHFAAGAYFSRSGTPSLFDVIPLRFTIAPLQQHYHLPLLLAPWGYSTYRGS